MNQLDPRTRILIPLGLLVVVVALKSFTTLTIVVALTFVIVWFARVPRKQLLTCVVSVNLFMLLLALSMPWSRTGEAWFHLGPFGYTHEGFRRVLQITLRANTVVLATVALIGTLEPTLFGRACRHLHMPDKLVHLMLFMVRYLDVLKAEYHRLLTAAKLRGFQPSLNRHTFHTFGQLAGMLLVRSVNRSERIVAAMKCRGFSNRFYLLGHLHYTRIDAIVGMAFVAVLTGLVMLEYFTIS